MAPEVAQRNTSLLLSAASLQFVLQRTREELGATHGGSILHKRCSCDRPKLRRWAINSPASQALAAATHVLSKLALSGTDVKASKHRAYRVPCQLAHYNQSEI